MKAISILQPWASLVVLGHKRIETRSWDTKYRGPLLIHASAKKSTQLRAIMLDFQQEFSHLYLPKYEDLPFGKIIGEVNLLSTIETSYAVSAINCSGVSHSSGHSFEFSRQEKRFGDYSPGRYGWLLSDPVLFNEPIPAKGQLGIWSFNESVPGI